MKKLKIAVYAIAKNEEKFVERFCASAREADLILIADTGSTDSTVGRARAAGAQVYPIHISPWRFDRARDAALALIPSDIDVCVSLDLDEVLEPGWREEIEAVWTPATTRLRYGYDWGNDIKFQYEKIHSRNGYSWHHPCHEYPRPDARINEVWAETQQLLVRHLPDNDKSRGQYLGLLELAVKEDPQCPRNAFYYARELTFYKKWTEAVLALQRYLDLPTATWANERGYAMRLYGRSMDALGQQEVALQWYRRATAEDPYSRETWCDLSLAAYRRSAWQESYYAACRAVEIKHRELVYTADPAAWGSLPHDLAAVAAWNLGLRQEALEAALAAAQIEPDNLRLKGNVEMMRQRTT
jgi:glycosyltransferase involved in cell wall biosynthesis